VGKNAPRKAVIVLGKCSSRHRHGWFEARRGRQKGADSAVDNSQRGPAERHVPSTLIRKSPKQSKQEKGMSARLQVQACRAFFALVSHLHSPSQCYTMTSGNRPAEPAQATYLTHSSTLNARHPTPDNTPRTRKPKSKKKREDRYEEEIQYNLSYNFRGAGSRRQAQPSRMRDDAGLSPYMPSSSPRHDVPSLDFPPPPTYETATAVSTLVSENFVHQGGPPHPGLPSPATTVASLPVSVSRAFPDVSDRSDTFSIDTASQSLLQPPRRAEDRSSIELVDLEPSERWELDRMRGIPLDERVQRLKLRSDTKAPLGLPIPHRARLASQPTVSRGPGSQARFLASQLSLRIPESRDPYEDDRSQDNSDLSTPPTPKHHRMPSIPGSPSRFFHGRSQSPQPSSSVISLLRNPSPFFKSTPSLLNISPSHNRAHRTRTKLFNRKSKERASSEPLEDWEVLERTGSGESSIDGSLPPSSPPATPHSTAVRQLPESTSPDVFFAPPTADRSRKVNTVQIPSTVGAQVYRPASPPFVARHVRRHTTSSRGSQMSASSAPVSPISVCSTSTFNTSTISLSQNSIASEDVPAAIQALANRVVASEPPLAVGSRGFEASLTSRTPRVSSPAPPAPAYEHDPDLPIVPNPALGSLPTRSATERIVRSPDARDLVRGRSLSRDMGMRSAPAYSSIFPSGPPTPLLNMTQSLPPPTNQPSPRRHYPGRPLPATPPVSPSLTWILDKGVTQVAPHPKAIVSATPSTPPIPEGLLIDLDDDSLDTIAQPAPNPITPLVDFLGLDDDNGDDDDNASDSGTLSPPGPLTPTTSGYTSASSLTLSTAASRSVEYFDTSMQTTPTSDVPDINGLVSSLGDHGMSDGSNYDVSSPIDDDLRSYDVNKYSCLGASPHCGSPWASYAAATADAHYPLARQ
jgi:hypothetical protein